MKVPLGLSRPWNKKLKRLRHKAFRRSFKEMRYDLRFNNSNRSGLSSLPGSGDDPCE